MAKHQKTRVVRALPPATAPPQHRPQRETVVIHTTREKSRNASGGSMGEKGFLVPLIGGIAGGTATVLAAGKLQWHPVAVAAAAAVGGIALASQSKTPWVKQAAMGAAIGAGTLGGVTLAGSLMQPKPAAASHAPSKTSHRAADGGDATANVTKKELQDALVQHAETQKEQQKQLTCDLMTVLREEIRQTVTDMKTPSQLAPFLHTTVRGADERDAEPVDYMRDAYGDEPRDAGFYDERDAGFYEERDAGGYDERDAGGYDERDAIAYDERDAVAYDERDAGVDERDAEVEG